MSALDILKNRKIIYYDAPKCGSTTIIAYARLIHNPTLSRKQIVEQIQIEETDTLKDSIKFCIVRDPIERFVSTYKALILSGNFVTSSNITVEEFIKIIDADKSTLSEWKQVSPTGWEMVNFHFKTQTYFYGRDPSKYTHIFNINEMHKVRQLLEEHSGASLPDLKMNASNSMDVNLNENEINWVKRTYAKDYKFYGKWMSP